MQKNLQIYCDGGSRGNPGPAACAFIIKDHEGKIIHQQGKFLNQKTNNEAEYEGVILALEWLNKNKKKLYTYCHPEFILSDSEKQASTEPAECVQDDLRVAFFLDSKLIVNQLNGLFKIKNSRLRELILKIKIKEKEAGGEIYYNFISREKNEQADKLVNKTLGEVIN